VSTLIICGRGSEADADGLGVGVGNRDGDAVGDGDGDAVGDGDGDAVGDGDGDADAVGDLAAADVADGELPRPADVAGALTVTTTGMISGAGFGPGEARVAGERDAAGREGCVAVGLGTNCAAVECRAALPGGRLNTTDAARTPATAPAAVNGRRQRRREMRWGELAG